jgi:hypothetical protein
MIRSGIEGVYSFFQAVLAGNRNDPDSWELGPYLATGSDPSYPRQLKIQKHGIVVIATEAHECLFGHRCLRNGETAATKGFFYATPTCITVSHN